MADIKVTDINGCSHIDFDVTIEGVTHKRRLTKQELVATITGDELKVDMVLRNACIYYRKRKAQGEGHADIIAEIEAKEFSL